MIRVPAGSLPCYTFGGMYRDCYDVKIARKIAGVICGQQHRVLDVSQRFFHEFPALAEKTVSITDGNIDVTGAADLYVNKMAREIAPVTAHRQLRKRNPERVAASEGGSPPARAFRRGLRTADPCGRGARLPASTAGHRVSFAAFKQTPVAPLQPAGIEQSQLTLRSPFLDNELVELMYQAPTEALDSSELSFRLINDGNPDWAGS